MQHLPQASQSVVLTRGRSPNEVTTIPSDICTQMTRIGSLLALLKGMTCKDPLHLRALQVLVEFCLWESFIRMLKRVYAIKGQHGVAASDYCSSLTHPFLNLFFLAPLPNLEVHVCLLER